jgi:anti-sigma factor RsiW
MTLTIDAIDAMRSRMLEAQHRTAAGDCRRAVPRFAAYLEGRLADADVGVLHRHLDTCATCVRRLDGVEEPAAVLIERIAEPPEELDGRLLNLLLREGPDF